MEISFDPFLAGGAALRWPETARIAGAAGDDAVDLWLRRLGDAQQAREVLAAGGRRGRARPRSSPSSSAATRRRSRRTSADAAAAGGARLRAQRDGPVPLRAGVERHAGRRARSRPPRRLARVVRSSRSTGSRWPSRCSARCTAAARAGTSCSGGCATPRRSPVGSAGRPGPRRRLALAPRERDGRRPRRARRPDPPRPPRRPPPVAPEAIHDLERLLPGEGVVDFAAFFAGLAAAGYGGAVTPEIPGYRCAGDPVTCGRRALAATRAVLPTGR